MSHKPTSNTANTPSYRITTPGHTTQTPHGSGGQHAAENTKGAFAKAGEATESVRQNINAYADTMISGESKTDRDNDYHTQEIKQHGGTGIHPDAKKAGDEAARGLGKVAGKMEDLVDGKKTTSSPGTGTTRY